MQARTSLTPIARIDELAPLERQFVRLARSWRAGRAAQIAALAELATQKGPRIARLIGHRMDDLVSLISVHGRRDLVFAPVGSAEALGDECVLARLVGLAAEGNREDAALVGMLLIRADLAIGMAGLAQSLALLLLRGPAGSVQA